MNGTIRVHHSRLKNTLSEIGKMGWPVPKIQTCSDNSDIVILYWDDETERNPSPSKGKGTFIFVSTADALEDILKMFTEKGYHDPRIQILPESEFHDFELIYQQK